MFPRAGSLVSPRDLPGSYNSRAVPFTSPVAGLNLADIMDILTTALQVIVATGIFNVWFIRCHRTTPWRGGSARNMREEFAAYGLAVPMMIMAGIAKVLCAAGLIAGLYWPSLIVPSATLLTLLMLVAIALHFKIRDALVKSLPAIAMLVLCLSILGMSMLRG